MAYLDRPNPDQLSYFWGYVQNLWVEQTGDRDQIRFDLRFYYDYGGEAMEFEAEGWNIYLDAGTTVALAQLQLLRDAIANQWLVLLQYYDDPDSYLNHVYYVRVFPNAEFPQTVNRWLQ